MASHEFAVVGAGISGLSCARALQDAGRSVVVHERDGIGGRTVGLDVDGRHVDVGAAYFTVHVPAFEAMVTQWLDQGLAVPWTDTFHVAGPDGLLGTRTGPVRYTAPDGLSSLAQHLADDVEVHTLHPVARVGEGSVDGATHQGVAVAVPSPLARDLLEDHLDDERAAASAMFDPCLTVVLEYADRSWPDLDAVFVNDSAVLTFVVDDGSRRGDGRPVLVAYASAVLSAAHLADPPRVVEPVLAALRGCMGVRGEPLAAHVVAWPYAKPRTPDAQPYHLGRHRVGLCGDAWHAPSRIESAFLSGRALGRALVQTT